jgi:hypothetical protein
MPRAKNPENAVIERPQDDWVLKTFTAPFPYAK